MELRHTAAVFVFFLALAVIFTIPISLAPHKLAANDGDPLHVSWIMAWDAHQLVRDPANLFDTNTFYPYETSLAFSEHLIGLALLGAPFFYLTGNALLAQNVALILTLAFAALAMYLLVKEIAGRDDAAVVAGMVYVFHTYNLHEVPRAHLLTIQWLALALLFLHRSFVHGGRKNVALFGLFFILHGLSCTYYLFYLALVLAFWIPAYLFFLEDGWRRLLSLVVPLGVAGAFFGLLSIPYLRMVQNFDYQRALAEGLDLIEYFRPPGDSVYAWLLGSGETISSVTPQFLGFVVLVLALIGILSRPGQNDRATRLFFGLSVTTALVGFVLSLGPTVRVAGETWGTGPYNILYEHVPFFRVLRNAERINLLVHFGLAVAAGFGARALFSRLSGRALPIARIAVLVVLPMEHFNGGRTATLIPTGDSVPAVYRWLANTPLDEPVVELPLFPRTELRRHAIYNFFSTYHWRPIIFGRTSFYPPLVGYLAWEMRDFPNADSIALLEGLGVARVVVHPKMWPLEIRGEKLASLRSFGDRLVPEGRFAPLEGHPYDTYRLGEERVYRLQRAGTIPSTSTLCAPEDPIEPEDWTLRGEAETPHIWAVDRDRSTKWHTDKQLPGWKLQIDLGTVETIAAVRLELGYPHDQFPRDLRLKTRVFGERFAPVDYRDDLATKWELVDALINDPSGAAVILRFEPIEAQQLRFWIREGKGFDYALPDWSMPELYVYRRCTP